MATKAIVENLRRGIWLSELRVRRIAVSCVFLFSLAFGVEIWLHIHLQPDHGSLISFPIGQDFSNFWAGSVLALHGQARTVFDLRAFSSFQHSTLPPFHQFRWYAYPPTALLLLLPIGLLPYLASYTVWIVAGGLTCALMLTRQLRWPMAIAAAIFTPASFINAVSGQNGAFTAAIISSSLMLLNENAVVSGILISFMCVKPHLAILLPLALVAAKRLDVLAVAAFGCALWISLSLIAFGADTWQGFFQLAPLNQVILERGHLPAIDAGELARVPFWYRMPTVFAAAKWFGAENWLAFGIQLLSAIFASVITWRAWSAKTDIALKGAILIFATFAVTPYAWDYDLVMLTFAIVWLWTRGKTIGYLPYEKTLLACLFASTLISPAVERIVQIPLQALFIWTLLLFSVFHLPAESRLIRN